MALVESALDWPLRKRKSMRVFVNSMSDLFHENVPDEWIDRVFAVMALAPWHTFLVLTKRAARMRGYMRTEARGHAVERAVLAWHTAQGPRYAASNRLPEHPLAVAQELRDRLFSPRWPLPNVQLVVSAENRDTLHERGSEIVQTPAAIRGLSLEPLLGPVDVEWFLEKHHHDGSHLGVQWVIVGGESGPGARGCDLAWVGTVVDQCREAGVPCFVKQLGAHPFETTRQRAVPSPTDREAAQWVLNGWTRITIAATGEHWWQKGYRLRDRKGGDPLEWPESLRVREYPGG